MPTIHFKMETLHSGINNMRKNCFLGINKAFYSIPIQMKDWKYFRFYPNNQKYQLKAWIIGLSQSPRVLGKLSKPVFALRSLGHASTGYIDHFCLWLTFKQYQRHNTTHWLPWITCASREVCTDTNATDCFFGFLL